MAPIFFPTWARHRAIGGDAGAFGLWDGGRASATIDPSRPPPSIPFYWIPHRGFAHGLLRRLRAALSSPRLSVNIRRRGKAVRTIAPGAGRLGR